MCALLGLYGYMAILSCMSLEITTVEATHFSCGPQGGPGHAVITLLGD